jgi:hypothetical protein
MDRKVASCPDSVRKSKSGAYIPWAVMAVDVLEVFLNCSGTRVRCEQPQPGNPRSASLQASKIAACHDQKRRTVRREQVSTMIGVALVALGKLAVAKIALAKAALAKIVLAKIGLP